MATIELVDGKITGTCCGCKQRFSQDQMLRAMTHCKPCWRGYMRQRRYGITQAQYDALLKKQGGKCAICGGMNHIDKKNGSQVRNLAVDHDATTGDVRGLLCGRCNRGIGYLKNDAKLLSRAARYLVGLHS